METVNIEKELNTLQNELRGINVMDLTNEEFENYKKKADRVKYLMNELYNFKRV
jgi:hypothetical protein